MHFVRIRQKGDPIFLSQPIDQVLHPWQRSFEKVGPGLLQLVKRPAISRLVAEKLMKIGEAHRAAFQVAVGARGLEQLHELIASHCSTFADVLQHALVRQLDDCVAEVEDEPGDIGHWLPVPGYRLPESSGNWQPETGNYIRNTPNRGSSIG